MRSRILRFCILLSTILVIAYSGCSEQRDSISVGPATQTNRRIPTLDPRPNPLREYIQDTWVNGSTTATGGSNYTNIKIYGHSYANLEGEQADADFIAEHFDMYTWGGPIVGASSASLNPDMLWITEAGNIPCIRAGYDSSQVAAWIGLSVADTCIHGNPSPGNNAQGYGWDDILLLYMYDTTNWVSTYLGLPHIPGWNPDDDTDGDGCIEPNEGDGGEPSEGNRSAQDYYDACVVLPAGSKVWRLGDVASPGYIASEAAEAIYEYDTWGVEGYHFDEAAYQPMSIGLGNTFRYEGLNENATDFPYSVDKIAFVRAVMDIVEDELGSPIVAAANMVNSGYPCNIETQHDAALEYLENLLLEIWIPTGTGGAGLATTSKRAAMLNCPETEYYPQDKGLLLTCYDPSPSDRGKLFSLGMFYMINHQMAFYYYRTNGHDGHDAEQTQWNPWVAYDVGQPMVNNLGLNDFQGNSGTNKFFVFATGSTYEILGRQYLRSDGKKILVLVKLMADGQTEGAGSASHALGASYKKLNSNFTWGSPSTSVTMTNNSAVILLRHTPPGCHDCEPES